ncbi:hypothetical protein BC834DRAFT_361647 [Gloeopeniophorella convolvens]|nr:hypothetical protein BC834DRAFT_361647 [Gloeopeniophorella convolvens]
MVITAAHVSGFLLSMWRGSMPRINCALQDAASPSSVRTLIRIRLLIYSSPLELLTLCILCISAMCTITTTYNEHACGATEFSGRSHVRTVPSASARHANSTSLQTDCGSNKCAGSRNHVGQHPGQACTAACHKTYVPAAPPATAADVAAQGVED